MRWLLPNERAPYPHLRPLVDLTNTPDLAEQIASKATLYFHLDFDTIYSGVARPRDADDSESYYYFQVWHGDRLYRTVRLALPYVGVLNAQIPGDIQVEKYLHLDSVGNICRRMGKFELAPACIGYVNHSSIVVRVPEIPD